MTSASCCTYWRQKAPRRARIGHLLQHVLIIIAGMIAVIGHRDQASPLAIYLAQDGVEQGVSLRRHAAVSPLQGAAQYAEEHRLAS